MLFFAFFTLGYFAGVFTALVMFPPRTTELEMQEKDALQPILDLEKDGKQTFTLAPPMAGFFEFSLMRTDGKFKRKV